jgi:hypothetical protein
VFECKDVAARNRAIRRSSIGALLAIALGWSAVARGQSPVTITVDPQRAGAEIPGDFAGLSFEASNLLPEQNGSHIFDPANQPLVALFRTLGIKSLRIGGATADMPRYAVPREKDIDKLFAFAAAADVKVLYTLRLPAADVSDDAAIAKYIDGHYRSQLTCFEIGNEPDFYRRIYRDIPDYATYRGLWKTIADAVAKAVPGARFCGPAAGGTTAWARSFAEDFAKSGRIAAVVQHEYPGGDGNLIGGATARDAMMSRAWLETYDRLYTSFAVAARAHALPFRLEETNNFTGGAKDASDTFTASLWALEYLHWWAARGAAGMNFHNRRWILNTTIYPVDAADDGVSSGYRIHPMAYGIKAFSLGSHGAPVPLAISNPEAFNVTAYAVRDGNNLLVTVINKKDPATPPQDAVLKILAGNSAAPAEALFLVAPGNDVASKEGITLGGASIVDGSWNGKWTTVQRGRAGETTVRLPGTSGVVIRISLAGLATWQLEERIREAERGEHIAHLQR